MKIIVPSLLAVLAGLWLSAANACETCQAPNTGLSVIVARPAGCTLSPTELSDRVTEFGAILARREEARELEDGYAFRFRGDKNDLVARLATLVVAERQCCSLLGFELKFAPEQGPVWMTVRGPQEIKELIASLIEMTTDATAQP